MEERISETEDKSQRNIWIGINNNKKIDMHDHIFKNSET
jgi:hypothetical protein